MNGDRFRVGGGSIRPTPTNVEDIPFVDSTKLDPVEMAAIERILAERDDVIQTLQTDVLEIESERDALQEHRSRLESEREELQERIRQLEIQRPSLEPTAVFSGLGAAIGDVRADLAEERYTIEDVSFTLKANVINTDDGLRMHLPSLDETFAAENLSEVSFRVGGTGDGTEQPESDYNEVPDLLGRQRAIAETTLRRAGLTVGEVTAVEDGDTEAGTVVDQFPEPYTVAPPEAPVDLTVVVEPGEEAAAESDHAAEVESNQEPAAETEAETETAQTDESTAETESESDSATGGESETETGADPDFDEADVEETEYDPSTPRREPVPDSPSRPDSRRRPRLPGPFREAGLESPEAAVELEPDRLATLVDLPRRTVLSIRDTLAERVRSSPPLEDIDGIGPTYGSRLREGGVGDIDALADMEPAEVAELTGAPKSRTASWIEEARERRE